MEKLRLLEKEGDSISLTTDAWTSRACKSYATTTCHFIDEAWQMQCCVLETIDFRGSHTTVRKGEKLIASTERFQLPARKIKALVHDQAANVELVGEMLLEDVDWNMITCGAHRLQNCIKTAFEDSGRRLDNLLSAYQGVVSHFNRSALPHSITAPSSDEWPTKDT